MHLARRLAQLSWKSLSIVGTAKNAGKTTVLNYVYRHLDAMGFGLGLMSTGRDGEAVDTVTNEPKPRIEAKVGTLVATAHQALADSSAHVEVLETLPITTIKGRLTVARVQQPGQVELVGPAAAEEVRLVVEALAICGATRILVDGSMDRRRAAAPHITGHVILVSGAALAGARQAVIERTALWVEVLGLPVVPEIDLRQQLLPDGPEGVMLLQRDAFFVPLGIESALSQEEAVVRALRPEHSGVVLPGAFTDDLARALTARGRPLRLVVNDATCVFLSQPVYRRFLESGGRLEVLHPIRLLAVCINPVGRGGVAFDAGRFMDEVARALPPVPVFDIVAGLYREGGYHGRGGIHEPVYGPGAGVGNPLASP